MYSLLRSVGSPGRNCSVHIALYVVSTPCVVPDLCNQRFNPSNPESSDSCHGILVFVFRCDSDAPREVWDAKLESSVVLGRRARWIQSLSVQVCFRCLSQRLWHLADRSMKSAPRPPVLAGVGMFPRLSA